MDRIAYLEAAVAEAGPNPESFVVWDLAPDRRARTLSDALIAERIHLAIHGERRPVGLLGVGDSDKLSLEQLRALWPHYEGRVLMDDGTVFYLNRDGLHAH